MSAYGEKHQILHDSQERFRAKRSTSRQLQLLIAALEDARFTNQDIYLLYIDFKNAFGSFCHARLLGITKDLGYPEDAVTLIGNIYSNSNTIFTGEHFGKTKPIPLFDISRIPTYMATKRKKMDTHSVHPNLQPVQQHTQTIWQLSQITSNQYKPN